MIAPTLRVMAKNKKPDESALKRKTISLRLDPKLIDQLDTYCSSQEVPLDRTAFIEVAIKKFLEVKLSEQKRA